MMVAILFVLILAVTLGSLHFIVTYSCCEDQVSDREFEIILSWFKTNRIDFVRDHYTLYHKPTGYELWVCSGLGFYSIYKDDCTQRFGFSFLKQYIFKWHLYKAERNGIIEDTRPNKIKFKIKH